MCLMKYITQLNRPGLYSAVLLLFCFSCKDEPEVPLDPCQDAQPFTANFHIEEHVGDSLVVSDSILFYNLVTFEAPGFYSSFEWKIGEDVRTFDTRRVTLRFLEDAVGEIPIRLIATGPPNTTCYPMDNGIDTLEQTLHVITWKQAPMIGKYKGYFDSNPDDDQQVVEIKFISSQEDISYEPFGGFELINIDKGCFPFPKINNTNLWNFINRGVKAMKFDASHTYFYECNAPIAWLTLQSKDTLNVDFTYGELGTESRIQDKFIGVRVNE